MLPILLGAIPFAVTYGVLAFAGGFGVLAALGMSSIVFAGSAQFVAVHLFTIAAPVVVIVVTTFMVNLRHALYSAVPLSSSQTSSFTLEVDSQLPSHR